MDISLPTTSSVDVMQESDGNWEMIMTGCSGVRFTPGFLNCVLKDIL